MLKDKKLVFLLFLLSQLIRLASLLNSYDTDRLGEAIDAIQQPGWSMGCFIPRHAPSLETYLIKISRLFNESPMVTRIPNFILGSLLVIPFYYLVKILYNQKIALFSALALSIFHKHINISVTSCSEIPFYFFLFTALAFFFKFQQDENKKISFLILSALTLPLWPDMNPGFLYQFYQFS